MGRVLAIFAHPDDESLLAGGTLAACAAQGHEVAILSLTRGEAGPISQPGINRETLGTVRETELRAAATALGVSNVECLGYPDGELSWADGVEIEADIAGRIEAWRPEVVITFGPEGLYWHPDHIATHNFTTAAIEQAAGVGFAPWVYHVTWPDHLAGEMVAAIAKLAQGRDVDLWGLHPSDFGVPTAEITTVVDVRPFTEAKVRAIRSHRSQLAADHLFQVMPIELAKKFLAQEYFVRVQPKNATDDLLQSYVSPNFVIRNPQSTLRNRQGVAHG
jgi:N-acetyl-1-D-myo-inositol-2-amino-2-deoxy-alpha-D-glucopyranoside deacetylase